MIAHNRNSEQLEKDMPLYEYECQLCRTRSEMSQEVNDRPLVICPECHQPGLRRLIAAGITALTQRSDARSKGCCRRRIDEDAPKPSCRCRGQDPLRGGDSG